MWILYPEGVCKYKRSMIKNIDNRTTALIIHAHTHIIFHIPVTSQNIQYISQSSLITIPLIPSNYG